MESFHNKLACKTYPLLGFSTSWGRFGVIRALGGKLTITPQNLVISWSSKQWLVNNDISTSVAASGFILHIKGADKDFHVLARKPSEMTVSLMNAGYKLDSEGDANTRLVLIFIVIAVTMVLVPLVAFILQFMTAVFKLIF